MQERLDYIKIAPDALKAMRGLETYVRSSGLDRTLLELIKTRASQINGCAYCVDAHSHDLLTLGESAQRLAMVAVFDEGELVFSEQERAALAWAEACTRLSQGHVSDAVFERVKRHFDDRQLAELTVAIATINAWNRIGASLRLEVKPR